VFAVACYAGVKPGENGVNFGFYWDLFTLLVQAVTAQSLDAFESMASQSVAEENGKPSWGEGEDESNLIPF
jgi:hypothetical protein